MSAKVSAWPARVGVRGFFRLTWRMFSTNIPHRKWKTLLANIFACCFVVCVVVLLISYGKNGTVSKIGFREHSAYPLVTPRYGENLVLYGRFYSNSQLDQFCVYPNVLNQTLGNTSSIVMTLHTSADKLGKNILNMISHWKAPISLAVYASSDQLGNATTPTIVNTYYLVRRLAEKSELFRQFVVVHLYAWSSGQNQCAEFAVSPSSAHPETPFDRIEKETRTGRYPANTGRNVARKFALTSDYILIADMDQWYSPDAATILLEIAQKQECLVGKKLLVVRRFEYEKGTRFPLSISELKRRMGKDVFVFHKKYYKQGHEIPGLTDWLRRGDTSREIHLVRFARSASRFWEPMFLASSSIPYHDENLIYGWRDHFALAAQLCVDGYTFSVVDGVYNAHEGVKTLPSSGVATGAGWPNQTIVDLARTRMDTFRKQLAGQYPDRAVGCMLCQGDPKKGCNWNIF